VTEVMLDGLGRGQDVAAAEDARREGFDVVVIEDACRSIDMDRSEEATRHRFKSLGILCVLAANVRGRERALA
jgi:nicotinamidase/pyrazinamidase